MNSTVCVGPECDRPTQTRNLCATHWAQLQRTGETWVIGQSPRLTRNENSPCTGPQCDRLAYAKGLCKSHYSQSWRGGALRPLRAARSGVQAKCAGCGKAFRTTYLRALNFCSHKCRQERKRQIERKRTRLNPRMTVDLCAESSCHALAAQDGLCKEHWTLAVEHGQTINYWRANKHAPLFTKRKRVDGYVEVKIGVREWVREHRFFMECALGRPLLRSEEVHHKNGIKHDNRLPNLELWSSSQPAGQRITDKVAWCREFLAQYGDLVDQSM